jgi:hypothetical protein
MTEMQKALAAVIARCGGVRPFARLAGVPASTAHYWFRAGVLRAVYRHQIMSALRKAGKPLTREERRALFPGQRKGRHRSTMDAP